LFEGIISDLFPGVVLPAPDFGVFMDALKNQIAKHKLQPVPWFIDKIIQVTRAARSVRHPIVCGCMVLYNNWCIIVLCVRAEFEHFITVD